MAEFLTTQGVSYHLEDIILKAKKTLLLISPYLKLTKTLFERIKDASDRGIAIKVIYGKTELTKEQNEQLHSLKNVDLYFIENLHAKCYFNESKMIITSMNMYEYSEKNNREMGILIDRTLDKKVFEEAIAEVDSIIKASNPIQKQYTKSYNYQQNTSNNNYNTTTKNYTKNYTKNKHRGYCIHCSCQIDYDPSRPYCYECYQTWAIYENYNFLESNCHCCGKGYTTTMGKPECYSCY